MDKIIFLILLSISTFIAHMAEKREKKILLFVLIFILSIISGFRGIEVGIDTSEYYRAIVNNFPDSWLFGEPGFRFLSSWIYKIFGDAKYVFFIFSYVTNSLIIMRLWDFRKKSNFSMMFFLYFLIYYLETMNIMRQFFAIAILFYCTKFLDNKKYLLYLVSIFLCTLIHKTSLLALLILFIYYWNNLNKKKKIIMMIPCGLIMIITLYYIIVFESGHISNYFSSNNLISNLNIPFLYRLAIFIIAFSFYNFNVKIVIKKSDSNNFKNDLIHKKEINKISLIYFIGLLFSSLGMFYFIMARVGYFYLIFELLFWGFFTYKNNSNKYLNICMISIFAIYTFAMELIFNGSGIFPFYFNF